MKESTIFAITTSVILGIVLAISMPINNYITKSNKAIDILSQGGIICELLSDTVNIKGVQKNNFDEYLIMDGGKGGSWNLRTTHNILTQVKSLLKEGSVTATRYKNDCWLAPGAIEKLGVEYRDHTSIAINQALERQKKRTNLIINGAIIMLIRLKETLA